jgi:DNA-binding MarR family transcriptional regulator
MDDEGVVDRAAIRGGGAVASDPLPIDLARCVRELALGLERWRAHFARQHGLGVNDSVVLSHLATAGGRLLPRDLARLMVLRTGTLTAMLDRLEQGGFVRRVPNPDDRRSTFVELTTFGSDALATPLNELRDRLEAGMSARTRAQLIRQLAELNRLVGQIADESETRP